MTDKNWQNFLAEIESAKKELKFQTGEECFFRGHSNSDYALLPTLLRHARANNLDDYTLRTLEADLFFEFQARAQELHLQSLSDWEVLQFMRHHGVATRLLDWTEIFGVALYFAVSGASAGKTPCIWLLNPYQLNEHPKSWATRDLISPRYLGGKEYSDFMTDFDDLFFGWNHPVALYPIQRSARLQAQRGYFTIHGDDTRAVDKINPDTVRRVDLDPAVIPAALEFLALAGISDYTLFPDLDGLARDLHRKNNIF